MKEKTVGLCIFFGVVGGFIAFTSAIVHSQETRQEARQAAGIITEDNPIGSRFEVPGGWVYYQYNWGVFVPKDN